MKYSDIHSNYRGITPFEDYREISTEQEGAIMQELDRLKIDDEIITIDYGAICYTLDDAEKRKRFFLKRLELICNWHRKLPSDNKQDAHSTYVSYSKTLNNALSVLKDIGKGNLPVLFESKFFPGIPDDDMYSLGYICAADKYFSDCLKSACEAYNHLSKLINLIESKKALLKNSKRGREKALKDNLTLTIKYIALNYKDILGTKPTAYKDGPFFGIIRTAYQYFGYSGDDPSKRIQHALKMID